MAVSYTPSPSALKTLLLAVIQKGVPNEVSDAYLLQSGLQKDDKGAPSQNAKRTRNVIQKMGLIDEDYKPTNLWTKSRSERKEAFLEGLEKLYPNDNSALSSYESATDEELFDFFKGGSGLGDQTVKICVSTFNTIRDAALKGEEALVGQTKTQKKAASSKPTKPAPSKSKSGKTDTSDGRSSNQSGLVSQPQMVVNIQLQVPPDPTGEVYDKFFKSMRKYLHSDE